MRPGPVPLPPPALRVADLDGQAVGVWGAGREGTAALRALARYAPSSRVTLATSAPPPADAPPLPLGPDGQEVPWLHGTQGLDALADCATVIRSPGVPVRGPEADRVRARGAVLTSGTALWLAQRSGRETVVGVTGTKGKSTTSALLHHLLGQAGVHSQVAGNIGRPLLDLLDPEDPPEVWVVELSSYQLADLPQAPTVALVTNLRRDHLPWHGDEATYHADKLRILTAGTGPRLAVLSAADPRLRDAGDALRCPVLWTDVPAGLHVADGALRDGERTLAPIVELPLRGALNARNVGMALQGVRALGHDIPDVAAALAGFDPLPHRQQVVARRTGRTWVDDSISTTPEAALAALAAFAPGPIVLVAGGVDRDQEHGALATALVTGQIPADTPDAPATAVRVAGLVALPGTGPALAEAVALAAKTAGVAPPPVRQIDAGDPGAVAAATVAAARAIGPAGATILLSPAASSHNVFRDFEDRGDRFAAAVAGLPDTAA